jgi:2,4-dienoyl-CoA reductase (NADPH2)
VGARVAIIGAGGIGFDVAEFLAHHGPATSQDTDAFMAQWGIDQSLSVRGGLVDPGDWTPARQITLCQRKKGKLGAGLGKTTGWIHRTALKNHGVEMLGGCSYERIDDQGLHLTVDGAPRVLAVDSVIICAGQVPANALAQALAASGKAHTVIGGADVAAELDAKRAIAHGTRVAAEL